MFRSSNKSSKNSYKRSNRRQKITDEENRTARKSHCERTAVERQQCIADTVVRRRDGRRRISDHGECIARVGQQFMVRLGRTRLSEFVRSDGRTRHAIRPLKLGPIGKFAIALYE